MAGAGRRGDLMRIEIDTGDLDGFAALLEGTAHNFSAKELSRVSRAALKAGRLSYEDSLANDGRPLGYSKTKIRRKLEVVSANGGSATSEIIFRAGWFPLIAARGTRQKRAGVFSPSWGMHRGTFIATMPSGHRGVFKRLRGTAMETKPHKEQIAELWGWNPNREVERGNSDALEEAGETVRKSLQNSALDLYQHLFGH
ncbi:hypothetical protein [Polycladidibacter hongkongensis]|uniref:hypothetical protein n=1 Tax=Polycladidibacter hongkongensis TaxID=1647556 RepID=UPI00082FBE96|nr:hypothetical protein [Pseudovibrio hongkongensis]